MADLQMRLMGDPDEVKAVVAALREDVGDEPGLLLNVSPTYPNRSGDGQVRVYLKFDGARLLADLQWPNHHHSRKE